MIYMFLFQVEVIEREYKKEKKMGAKEFEVHFWKKKCFNLDCF